MAIWLVVPALLIGKMPGMTEDRVRAVLGMVYFLLLLIITFFGRFISTRESAGPSRQTS